MSELMFRINFHLHFSAAPPSLVSDVQLLMKFLDTNFIFSDDKFIHSLAAVACLSAMTRHKKMMRSTKVQHFPLGNCRPMRKVFLLFVCLLAPYTHSTSTLLLSALFLLVSNRIQGANICSGAIYRLLDVSKDFPYTSCLLVMKRKRKKCSKNAFKITRKRRKG